MSLYPAKQKLQERQPVFGIVLTECLSPEVVPALAACGLDFFILDAEHSSGNVQKLQALVPTCRRSGIAPLVRITGDDGSLIACALDCAAAGVIIRGVKSAGDLRRVVDLVKCRPADQRGFRSLLRRSQA